MIYRGEIYNADLNPVVGSEQGGIRPVLVVQNDVGNRYSPTVIVVALTSQIKKGKLPTHVDAPAKEFGLSQDSVILTEQIRTVDKRRLRERLTRLTPEQMRRVNEALEISVGMGKMF